MNKLCAHWFPAVLYVEQIINPYHIKYALEKDALWILEHIIRSKRQPG